MKTKRVAEVVKTFGIHISRESSTQREQVCRWTRGRTHSLARRAWILRYLAMLESLIAEAFGIFSGRPKLLTSSATTIISTTVLVSAFLILAPSAYAQSNSKGAKSSVVVGILKEVTAAGKELKVLQTGDLLRELHTDSKSKVYFVGIATKAARKATVGYGVKASCDKAGRIKTITFTPPIPEPKPLGEKRLSMTPAELFKQVDADKDGQVGYGEFSRSVYHSPKHGPDHFRKADSDSDGSLSSDEFRKALEKVSWWTLSKKAPEAWFQEADADGDEQLSKKEFAQICASGNHIDNIFKRADRDDSGDLSLRETTAYIRSVTHGKQKNRKTRKRDKQSQ